MTELPKIISVDDHVVEPAHLWQDRLPACMREKGPRVERARWGEFQLDVGASYKQEMTEDGAWGDRQRHPHARSRPRLTPSCELASLNQT